MSIFISRPRNNFRLPLDIAVGALATLPPVFIEKKRKQSQNHIVLKISTHHFVIEYAQR